MIDSYQLDQRKTPAGEACWDQRDFGLIHLVLNPYCFSGNFFPFFIQTQSMKIRDIPYLFEFEQYLLKNIFTSANGGTVLDWGGWWRQNFRRLIVFCELQFKPNRDLDFFKLFWKHFDVKSDALNLDSGGKKSIFDLGFILRPKTIIITGALKIGV